MAEKIHPKIEIVDIWWEMIKFSIPAFLIKGAVNAMIDAGPPQDSPEAVKNALRVFGVTPADISLVLNTHGHDDHIGGDRILKEAGEAKVIIHKSDAHYLDNPAKAFDEFYAIGTKALGDEQRLAQERTAFLKQARSGITADQYVKDNDKITVGDGIELRVLHLPGHTKGSVGYYWEEEGILIAGDAIQGLGSPDGSLPIIFDLPDYKESINRLLDLPLRTLVFTHAYRGMHLAPSTIRRGREINQYLSDSKEFAERFWETLLKQTSDRRDPFIKRADTILSDLPAEMGFVPIAKQFMPQFSISTIYWGLSQIKKL